jgi:hypothetical protein
MEALARHQTAEAAPTLGIASGAECECPNGTWCHRVVMFLVRLNVLSMFNSTMFGAINVEANDDCSRTEGLRCTKPMGEGIEPENVSKADFNEHSLRAVVERSRITHALGAFFCRVNASFNVRDMCIFATNVQFRLEVSGDSAAGAFEFTVSVNVGDAKPSFAAHAADALQSLNERPLFAVVECFGSDKSNLFSRSRT